MAPSSKDAQINIVGAGIFGLSTALHLARRGYKNVTVFDKQPYDATKYSYFNGCDAASAGQCNRLIFANTAHSTP
jgi:sarcosine oxidase/L-pipecolate oxidase